MGDRAGTNPLLGPLAGNGGPTQTMALQAGSPAIDGGDGAGCPATDQRGVPRPGGAACDVGAFEIATPRPTAGQAGSTGAAPALTRLRVSPSAFRAQPVPGAGVAKAGTGAFGATVSYRDTEQAVTRFTVQRPRRGFRSASRCTAKRPARATGKVRHCTLYRSIGGFRHTDAAGANRLHFSGRLNGKALAPGRYRLRAVARNATSRLSPAVHAAFRIVR